jgi:hypothetical protein
MNEYIWSFGGDNDRLKPKYHEENLSQCHCAHHKTHMDWCGSAGAEAHN